MKTWLTAIFAICRCVLYPGTKIVVASGVKNQAIQVIEKINEIMRDSPMLQDEIIKITTNTQNPGVRFINGSSINVAVANDNSRSLRANVLILDEFRAISKEVVDAVLKKFLAVPRHPKYIDLPEYAHLQEDNIQIYMSSAWFKYHWSYNRYMSFIKQMVAGKSYFVCNLPYQISVKNNLKKMSEIIDDMTEDDFDEVRWNMEMCGTWFGESENSFFDGDILRGCRRIDKAVYPPEIYVACPKDEKRLIIKKAHDEIRILSIDIALMQSKKHKNDASCIVLMQLIPNANKSDYIRNVSYIETIPGIHTENLALRIRKLYDQFECDYIVMDAGGIGQPIFDVLAGNPILDPDTGIEYEPLSCMNNEDLNERALLPNTPKVIFAVKAYSAENSEMILYLQNAINNRKIRFLIDENAASESKLQNLSGWDDYSPELKSKLQQPYIQTTYAIQEMLSLDGRRTNDGKLKVVEPGRSRKDRYSAIAMGNLFATELARNNFKKSRTIDLDDNDSCIGYFTV